MQGHLAYRATRCAGLHALKPPPCPAGTAVLASPTYLPALTRLLLLHCSHLSSTSYLSGTFPPEGWEALGSLVLLDLLTPGLSGQLAGAFPSSLETLHLISSNVTSISPTWQPRQLRNLLLTNNPLRQPLAQQLRWLEAAGELRELWLSDNSLQGTIPASLALPPTLTHLDLSSNELTGEGPDHNVAGRLLVLQSESEHH